MQCFYQSNRIPYRFGVCNLLMSVRRFDCDSSLVQSIQKSTHKQTQNSSFNVQSYDIHRSISLLHLLTRLKANTESNACKFVMLIFVSANAVEIIRWQKENERKRMKSACTISIRHDIRFFFILGSNETKHFSR